MKPSPFFPVFLISCACLSVSQAAVVASYDFLTDLNSIDAETTSTASAIQSGGGLGALDTGWGKSGSLLDLYIRTTVTSTALTSDDYVSFNVTISPGTTYSFTSLTFKFSAQATSSGIGFTTNTVVRSSLDNFATDLGSFSLTRVNPNGINVLSPEPSVDLSSFVNVSGTVEFRIYVYDDVDNTNSLTRIDNLVLNATIIPEPAGASLLVLGSLVLARRRR